MPARLSSMELSDPVTPESNFGAGHATNRRKSARARQKPVLLQDDITTSRASHGNGKRKRAEISEGGVTDSGDDILGEESSSHESDGDPDEEELKEKRRRAPRAKRVQGKPVVKKPRIAEARTTKLPVRPAMNGAKKASRPRKPQARSNRAVSNDETGLYGMLAYTFIISCRV